MAVWIGLGGFAFMLGNLALAAVLEPADFGRLALFEALTGIGVYLSPAGLDSLVVRRELRVGSSSLRRATGTSVLVALVVGGIAVALFGFDLPAVALLGGAVLAAATARMCAASEQAAVRLDRSQLLTQLPSVCFGFGAVLLALLGTSSWQSGAGVLVAGFALSALVGLGLLRRGWRPKAPAGLDRFAWRRALSFVGIMASVLVLHHVERLVIPRFLGLEALATFAVVATVVGSPYRILHSGVGYSLMPRIRAERSVRARRRLVRSELALIGPLGLAGGLVLLTAARPLIHALYGDKYEVSLAVVAAIIAVGVVRLFYAVASAVVRALADTRQLRQFNLLAWIGTALAAGAAVMFSGFGLVGVIAGAAVGWLVRLAAAVSLVRPAFAVPRLEARDEERAVQTL